jgi:hypothetical protein
VCLSQESRGFGLRLGQIRKVAQFTRQWASEPSRNIHKEVSLSRRAFSRSSATAPDPVGFVGADFGPFGRVAIGKQNAVHYVIAGYTTDRFNVFGGQGTSSYVAGTDGGATGAGRADRVVNNRNTIF